MLATYAFYVASTVKNRLLARFRRLKQPRYLVGLIVGLLYLAIVFGRSGPRPLSFDGRSIPIDPTTGGTLLTLFVTVIMLLAWALPDSQGGLDLTETEALFLFPAPITRGQLFSFVIARGLFPLLITTLVFKIFFLRGLSVVGLFAAMIALQAYFLMVRMARARLAVAGIGFLARVGVVLVVLGVVAWMTWTSYATVVPEILQAADHEDAAAVLAHVSSQPLETLPLSIVCFLPGLYVRTAALASLPSAALSSVLLAAFTVLFAWVAVRLDVSYEEATIAKAKKRAARREARLANRRGVYVSRRSLFRFPLSSNGRPEIAIVWKNTMAASNTMVLLFGLPAVFIVGIFVIVGLNSSWPDAGAVAAPVAFMLAAFSTLVGPVILRNDLRADLPRLDVLRSFPLTGARIVAAEVASPAILIFGVQAVCLVTGLLTGGLSGRLGGFAGIAGWATLAFCFALPLTVIQLLVHNGLVVLFPGWASFSKEDQRGIEALGRRILLLFAQLLTLVVGLIPAGLIFAVALVLMQADLVSPAGSLIAASTLSLGVLVVEIAWTVGFLGRQLDRIDPSDDMAIVEES